MFKIRFEQCEEGLVSTAAFLRRMAKQGTDTCVLIAVVWIIGAFGYRYIAGIPNWLDSFYNAAMILGGMGPVSEIVRPWGKVFASFYAIFSGVFLIASVGYFLTPALHRLVHHFHLQSDDS